MRKTELDFDGKMVIGAWNCANFVQASFKPATI